MSSWTPRSFHTLLRERTRRGLQIMHGFRYCLIFDQRAQVFAAGTIERCQQCALRRGRQAQSNRQEIPLRLVGSGKVEHGCLLHRRLFFGDLRFLLRTLLRRRLKERRRNLDRKPVLARLADECGNILRRGRERDGNVGRRIIRRKLFEHGGEFKLGEQRAAGSDIGSQRAHLLQLKLDRHIAVDRHQLFAEQDGVAIALQRLAVGLALDLSGAIERRLDAAELLDQFDRPFIANARRTGNIVDGVAAKGHHVDHLLRRNTERLHHFCRDRESGCPWSG